MYNQDIVNCYSKLYNGLIYGYRSLIPLETYVYVDHFVRGLINLKDYLKNHSFEYIYFTLDKDPHDCVYNDLRSTFNRTIDAFLFLRKSNFDLFDLLRQMVFDIRNICKNSKEDTVYIVYRDFLKMFFMFFPFYTRRKFSTNFKIDNFGDLRNKERNLYFFINLDYYKEYYLIYIYNGLYKYGKVKNIKKDILENSTLLHIVNDIVIFEDFRSYLRICQMMDKNEGTNKNIRFASHSLNFSFHNHGHILKDFLKARDYILPKEEKTKLNMDF